MTIRVYLMPMVQDPSRKLGTLVPWVPKYVDSIAGRYSCKRYGPEQVCLLIADVTDPEHAAVTANADVRAMPQDLDSTLTNAARTQIAAALESLNVPAHWIANGQTYRIVLRRLVGIFDLTCNVQGRGLRFLQASLDSQVSDLPQPVRTAMQDAADTLGLSTAGITGATTVRAALASIGAQFDSRPVIACRSSL